MNVIVGKAFRHKTPVFEKDMRYVVFRPYWNVPPSIQRAEIVPAIQKDRDYIAKKGFEVVTPGGTGGHRRAPSRTRCWRNCVPASWRCARNRAQPMRWAW